MQSEFLPEDLSRLKVLVSLSGGINSAALLCYLTTVYPVELRPTELYLFYADLEEHSDDTLEFAQACIEYAKRHYAKVTWRISYASVIEYFRNENMIPHPMLSPCSRDLKIVPMMNFVTEHNIDVDLVGYVRTEKRRIKRQVERHVTGKLYPISHLTNEDCFDIVKQEIGWYPAIYDIKDESGKQVFSHNNCLPCKNMEGRLDADGATGEYKAVEMYFPSRFKAAQELAVELDAHWGRTPKNKKEAAINFNDPCLICSD